jgi:hypothetical protein
MLAKVSVAARVRVRGSRRISHLPTREFFYEDFSRKSDKISRTKNGDINHIIVALG